MRDAVVADGDLVLAVPVPADADVMSLGWDGSFDVDRDAGPIPPPFEVGRATVVHRGEVVGTLSWHQVHWGPARGCASWNLGIGLLPAARGRRLGGRCLRLLADHLLATTDIDRLEASTDVDNIAAQRAIEAAGLRREGVVRGAQLRGGVRRDLVLYGRLRSD